MKEYNVLEYGLINDGKTLNSSSLQKLIDLCSKNGGKIVFPKGKYVLSTVFLKSNVHIFLEEEAEILGSLDFSDYAPDEKIDYIAYQDVSHTYYHCALFVGIDAENISISGKGKIDMRSVWDVKNVRKMAMRGPKCIALKNCKNVEISGLQIVNATDLAVYFSGCDHVDIYGLSLRVYIDGISPDNSKNVNIHDCVIESGDDGIVFKSSYTLNRIDVCDNIHVYNCKIKSRCHAIKFGTESNGGFTNFLIENIEMYETRIGGVSIECVDGAVADNIHVRNIRMTNVHVPFFIHVGRRMRGPEGRGLGEIKNVLIENVVATGPYVPYHAIAWNYDFYVTNSTYQYPWLFGYGSGYSVNVESEEDPWQMTSNICGLQEKPLKNITLKNIYLELYGGVKEFSNDVPEVEAKSYPEPYVYGIFLPARGIYFRHIRGLVLDNVKVKMLHKDSREDFIFDDVE